jgi:hypothetical protein
MIVFSALVCPNPPSWQCEVRCDRQERFAEDLGLPVGQPFDLNRAAEVMFAGSLGWQPDEVHAALRGVTT